MNVLERYIGRTILASIMLTLFMLVGLGAIIKFVEEFRSVGRGSYDGLHAAYYTLLTMPRDIETFFPIAALLGSLMGLGGLASRSELVVMQSAGFSRFRIGLAVMKTAIPLMVITMIMGEWGVPQTEQYARNMRSLAQSGGSMLATQGGFWVKDGNDFIYIRQIQDERNLNNILIYQFDNQVLKSIKQAEKATYSEQGWLLQKVDKSEIHESGITQTRETDQTWKTSITPSKLGIASLRPESLSISGLADYVGFLKDTGQDPKRFEITFWRKVFQPISMAVMMLLAISFIFGPLRSSTMGAKILIGILAGFVFYVANIVFGNLSLVVSWLPVPIGALIPSLLCLSVVWWLLNKKRD
ncbi:LPS export ABC transporter permease LptG [Glaesserella parasuis]|uniref:LPS export ABC transporter permease LptG n=1 Tax=Glaesserella parasuis TaxID=738 RepID=UPI0003AC0C12|nr:LPS export ABC transporter permease LptG [Glaesserella parasuis]ATW44692.1 lipopolysaccharide ABC transporter permease LptG [Glaesserella parasuis str. Nagasaki]EQA01229.1 lipopolysaccharide export system permease protein lptG [Glaesserella parasuis str. Nagasaki]EYE71352.1 lipopolysaccharide ABC transporter permease [Glaesserella parasuis str. Nagasaki]MCT8559789.1 LPS export ABC transporter permease LptG [Glaesserella parasuis]MCT8582398.1 LPS export ABC transporter permease LptG [Glaesse